MATILSTRTLRLGPEHNGVRLTSAEFDAAEFEEGWRYELVQGALIVSPAPSRKERSPNERLGVLLWNYKDSHPNGRALDATFFEDNVETDPNRRRADRVIYAGLGRDPEPNETPTIIVEFVSAVRRNFERDYEEKRDEYRGIGVKEYWIIDRFARTMTVYVAKRKAKRVLGGGETYTTPLLPGFELPLPVLFALSDRWGERPE